MTITRHTVLESRHRALGSPLGDWNGMDMPWEYDQDINLEHRAVRTAAGLFDVSGLKKVHITGPDAIAVMDHVCTRDMTKVYPGKSVYGLILNEEGRITDDCIAFHMSPNVVMMVYGGGTGMEQLQKSAEGKDVEIKFDDDLHNISLQGQQALPFLNEHTPYNLPDLKYFHQVPTTLFGEHCVLSRTGYSGERGYEIFSKAEATVKIWDTILEKGASIGIIPCSFNCIDMIRVEAGLLFYPYDMNEENTPWEVGLGFAIAKNKKADFRGREALMASVGQEKIKTFGIIADCDTAVDADAEIYQDGKRVGRVTQPMYSTIVNQSFAMVQLEPGLATPGIVLDVKGKTVSCTATTAPLPLLDPEKKKRSSK